MSLPHHNNNHIHSPNSFGGLLDHNHHPWPIPQENTNMDIVGLGYGLDSSFFFEQEHAPLMADLSILEEQGLVQPEDVNHDDPASMAEAHDEPSKKIKIKNQKLKGVESHEEELPIIIPKADRNAKERERRIKLHESYLGLGALLPDSRRSKKWSAPIIIDRVVEYIPELEIEIQKLTLKKKSMLAMIKNDTNSDHQHGQDHDEATTVTIHPVKRGEMIVQICTNRRRDGDDDPCSLSSIVHKLEEQGMCIVDASSTSLCDGGVCTYHLHVQMDGRSDGAEFNAEVFREKVISWLAT